MGEKLSVVLVDDQCMCRRGLSALLSSCYDGFDVLGTTDNIVELRSLLDKKPDLLIVDLRMKPMDGISLIQQLRDEGNTTPAAILTMSDSADDMKSALRIGARGYLLKDMSPDELVDALRRVAAGDLVVAPAMTIKMIDMLRDDTLKHETSNLFNTLSEREREILKLLSRGDSNKAIALNLKISYDTVKQHVRHILAKLNTPTRVKAAVLVAKEQSKFANL